MSRKNLRSGPSNAKGMPEVGLIIGAACNAHWTI